MSTTTARWLLDGDTSAESKTANSCCLRFANESDFQEMSFGENVGDGWRDACCLEIRVRGWSRDKRKAAGLTIGFT